MTVKEQLSASSQKIITPDKTLVGVKNKKEETKIPKPTGWRIIVLPFKQKEKNKRWNNFSRRYYREITSCIDLWFSYGHGTTLL